ncbi:MAG TPA: hypothetical protein VIR01_19550, partial [Pyrinomonadaceae bacterium]
CMLYAQVRQADDRKNRNILLAEVKLEYLAPQFQFFGAKILPLNMLAVNLDAPSTAIQEWSQDEIESLLDQYNLHHTTGLSVLAVEMMPRYDQYIVQGPPIDTNVRPLSRDLGRYRILRTSRLVAAPEIC